MWLDPEVEKRLRELHSQGYIVIIFTNQRGVQTGQQKLEDLQFKVEALIEKSRVPMTAYMALQGDQYRKPAPGMLTIPL